MVNEIAHLKLNLGEKTTLNPLAVKLFPKWDKNRSKIIYNLPFTILQGDTVLSVVNQVTVTFWDCTHLLPKYESNYPGKRFQTV